MTKRNFLEVLERVGSSLLASHEAIADTRQTNIGRAACLSSCYLPENVLIAKNLQLDRDGET